MELKHKGFTVFIESNPDKHSPFPFAMSICKEDNELYSNIYTTALRAEEAAIGWIDMTATLKGLFIYDASRYQCPFAAANEGALNCVDGWGIERIPTLAAMQTYINAVAKTLTYTGSPYTVVYINGGYFTSDMGEKYLGAALYDFPKLFTRPDFFEKSE